MEREAFAAAVLVARMQEGRLDEAPIWDDVGIFDGKPWRGVVDIISAGYPCQPFSLAGKRLGAADERHLWPYIARIVGEVQPLLVFLENVSGHLRLGFAEVVAELRAMGYEVAAGLFTAEEVGAPCLRERLFALAYRNMGDKRASIEQIRERALLTQEDCEPMETHCLWPSDLSSYDRTDPGISERVDRVRALGNAVVPVVAAQAFRNLAKALGLTLPPP